MFREGNRKSMEINVSVVKGKMEILDKWVLRVIEKKE